MMMKWIRSKIGAKLLIAFAAVLMLSMASLLYMATQMVVDFGKFAASENEQAIRTTANAFLARLTHEQALRYERIFQKIAASSGLIARQAALYLDHMDLYGKRPLKPKEKLTVYPKNGIFSNDASAETMVLYWGGPTLLPEINEQIQALSHLDPILKTVKRKNFESTACFAVTESGIARYYPNNHGVEKLPPATRFDIRNANWYVITRPKNDLGRKTVWSNIYLDSVGHGLLTTASTPIYSSKGGYLGAVGIDVTLDTLIQDILGDIPSRHKMDGMFSFLMDNQARLIAFPPEYLDMFGLRIKGEELRDASVTLDVSILDSSDHEIREMGEIMLAENYQVSGFRLGGQPYRVSSHFMPSTGWRLGIVVPESAILASVQETRSALDATLRSMNIKFVLLTAIFLMVSIIVIAILFIRAIVRPLGKLSKAAMQVRDGDLTTHVDIQKQDEMGLLARTFNTMVDTLRQAEEREKRYSRTLEQSVRDKTRELKQKNEDLKRSEAKYRSIYDNAQAGIFRTRLSDGMVIECNDRFARTFGYANRETCMAEYVASEHYVDPGTREQMLALLSEFGEVNDFEARFSRKDGAVVWIRFSARAFPERGFLEGVGYDITVEKKALAELKASEAKYRDLVENINEIIYAADAEGTLNYISPVVEQRLGYLPDEIIGRRFVDFVHEDHRSEIMAHMKALLKTGRSVSSEQQIVSKSGQLRWIRTSGRPVYENGEIVGLRGSFTDITESKELEAQLRQTQKMEAIATLTGGIAHDYNNLLTTILANITLAMTEMHPHETAVDFLHEAEQACLKTRDLTHRLMTLAKGGMAARETGLIESLLEETVQETLKDSKLDLSLSISENLLPVMYNSRQMGYALENIITNAVEAMPQGGTLCVQAENIRIEADTKPPELPMNAGAFVRISIQDEGPGIPEEMLGRIFDPYFSTKERGSQKGMGLGLTTAYAIVRNHGGYMDVSSTPGKGTRVNIYLPAVEDGMPNKKQGAENGQGPEESTHHSFDNGDASIVRILMMDDEQGLRKVARKMLERLGYAVKTAKDGAEAIDLYKKAMKSGAPFDAVILDLTVKDGMGGKQAIQEIRKTDPGVKAIIASGYFNDPVMAEFKMHGFGAAMSKPYQMGDIDAVLKEVLGKEKEQKEKAENEREK